MTYTKILEQLAVINCELTQRHAGAADGREEGILKDALAYNRLLMIQIEPLAKSELMGV